MNAQTKKQRIAQLLASGVKVGDAKLIVGVSEGYMTRLKEDEEFKALLKAYAAPDSEEAQEVEGATDASKEAEAERLADRYAVLESSVVNNLIAKAALADTKELVSVLSAINKQKAAASPAPQFNIGINGAAQITLSVPQSALGRDAMQLSSNNEVVAVQGQSLVSMDTQGAQDLLEKARKEKQPTAARESMLRSASNGAARFQPAYDIGDDYHDL